MARTATTVKRGRGRGRPKTLRAELASTLKTHASQVKLWEKLLALEGTLENEATAKAAKEAIKRSKQVITRTRKKLETVPVNPYCRKS